MKLKIATVWLAILLLSSMLYSVLSLSRPVTMTVLPEVPRKDEPVIVTFTLSNPSLEPRSTQYRFYANGELLKAGTTTITPGALKTYQYAYENPLEMGKQVNFLLKATSDKRSYEEAVSLPIYPPQIMSSFVSFASFSTSVMSSLITMTYYQSTFTPRKGMTVSAIFAIVLVVLLAYLELTRPRFLGRRFGIWGGLRIRFGLLSWVLFVIFLGVVFTNVVLIISA